MEEARVKDIGMERAREREHERTGDTKSRDLGKGRDIYRSRDYNRVGDIDRVRNVDRGREFDRIRDADRVRDIDRTRDADRGREKSRDRDREKEREREIERERGRFDRRRGETTRIGAGESYKPYGSRPRSPFRIDTHQINRDRSPRRDRVRSPVDNWHLKGGRDWSLRRHSRTPPRRERTPSKNTWRARSPLRRASPRRFSPQRENDRRARSPPRRDDRRKSRSPVERDHMSQRAKSPIHRFSPPAGPKSSHPHLGMPDLRATSKGQGTIHGRQSFTSLTREFERSTWATDKSSSYQVHDDRKDSKVQSRQRSPQSHESRAHTSNVHSRQLSPQAHESRLLPNKVQSRQRSPQAYDNRILPNKVQSRQRSPQGHENRMLPIKVQSRQRSPQAHEIRAHISKAHIRQRSPQVHEDRMLPDKVQSRQRSPQAHKSRMLPEKIHSRQRSPQAHENRMLPNKVQSRQRSPQAHDDRVHASKIPSRQHSPPVTPPSLKSRDRNSSKSPPRGPSGLRTTNLPSSSHPTNASLIVSTSCSRNGKTSRSVTSNSNSTVTPVVPPAGPRGYFPRGGSSIRGGRSTSGSDWVSKPDNTRWGAAPPLNRVLPIDTNQKGNTPSGQKVPTPSPSVPSTSFVAPVPSNSSTGIPTGPRAGISSRTSLSLQHPSSVYNRTTQSVASNSGSRQHPALANMISIIPGGRIDPTASAFVPDIATRLKRKAEEEILRKELHAKEEKLRLSLKQWKKLSKDSVAMELKSYLSEKHVRTLAGEGFEGSAF